MTDANPYSAPDAALETGYDETYSPSIISFQGRIGRMRYLAYSIGVSLVMMIVMMVVMPLLGASMIMVGGGGPEGLSVVSMLFIGAFYVLTIVFSVMFAKRRLNDLNRSGWWFLLFLVPVVNLLLAIYLIFFPGSQGSNNFGPAPAANSVGVLILGWSLPVLFVLGIVAAIAIPQFAGMPQ